MDGDIIRRIRQHKDVIGHYHTAGNPGRQELDDRQEINYPAILEEILSDRIYRLSGAGALSRPGKTTNWPCATRQWCAMCDSDDALPLTASSQ